MGPIETAFIVVFGLIAWWQWNRADRAEEEVNNKRFQLMRRETMEGLLSVYVKCCHIALSPKDSQVWMQALLFSVPLENAPGYVLERTPEGQSEHDLFGFIYTFDFRITALVLTGYRAENRSDSFGYRYVPLSVAYYLLDQKAGHILRVVGAGVSVEEHQYWYTTSGGRIWKRINEEESDRLLGLTPVK